MPGADGGGEPRGSPGGRHRAGPDGDVDGEEGDGAQSQVDLARERDRDDRGGGQGAPEVGFAAAFGPPRALVGEERERQEHGDPAEKVRAALGEAVRRERERETAERRGAGREARARGASRT